MMSHLLLHQIFELSDLLRVFRVAGDVLFIKERLETKEEDTSCAGSCVSINNTITGCNPKGSGASLPV